MVKEKAVNILEKTKQDMMVFKTYVEFAIAATKKHWLKKQYGMTQQDVIDMFMDQGGVCKICGVSPHLDNEKYKLHIDHCHETGNVRALLCSACNKALGFINDREDLALSMYNYLLTNKHGEQNMARLTRKQEATKPLIQPTLQCLSPRDAVAVEIALEWVRAKGTIRADVVPGIISVANAFAEGLGWQKAKKSAKQVAEEILDGNTDMETENAY